MVQEVNNPIHVVLCGSVGGEIEEISHIQVNCTHVVLSTVKKPEDGMDELVVRFFETTGTECTTTIFIKNALQAWNSDLREIRYSAIPCLNGHMEITLKPFEIRTLRVSR